MQSGYVNIQRWMRDELELSGNELIVYAIIYGFSQDGESEYKGDRQYLANWCGCTVRSVQTILNNLVSSGKIDKKEDFYNGVKFCRYSASSHPVQNFHHPSENISHNNLIDNKEKDLSNKLDKSKEKTSNRFSPPTVEEVKAYCEERGNNVDAERFVDFYTMKNWMVGKNKMKDWKAAVRTWEREHDERTASTPKKKNSKPDWWIKYENGEE